MNGTLTLTLIGGVAATLPVYGDNLAKAQLSNTFDLTDKALL